MAKRLYHGSRIDIRGAYLRPFKAKDHSSKDNSQTAVYATDRKRIALGMSLTGDVGTKSIGDYDEKEFQVAFILGEPLPVKRYVYVIDGAGFSETPVGSHQWTSLRPARILKKEVYETGTLRRYWRVASAKERIRYTRAKRKGITRKASTPRRSGS